MSEFEYTFQRRKEILYLRISKQPSSFWRKEGQEIIHWTDPDTRVEFISHMNPAIAVNKIYVFGKYFYEGDLNTYLCRHTYRSIEEAKENMVKYAKALKNFANYLDHGVVTTDGFNPKQAFFS